MPYKNQFDRQAYQKRYDHQRKHSHKAVKLTLTWDEYQRFYALAQIQKRSVPRFIHQLAQCQLNDISYLPKELTEPLQEITRLLRTSGNNINQIARSCNITSHSSVEGDELLRQIHAGLRQMEELIREKLESR